MMNVVTKAHRQNWLTRPPVREGFYPTAVLMTLMLVGTFLFYTGQFDADRWMPASPHAVFQEREYWRAWTTLFTHGDGVHLLSNFLLFIPFSYFLTSYFSPLFFPVTGFIMGGMVNLLVLKTLPPSVMLVGASGVVYWMGAAWVTLSFLIDRRETKVRRLLKSFGVSALLFLPQTYRPEVSYLAHSIGYVAGVLSGLMYYAFHRRMFNAADTVEFVDTVEPEGWEVGNEDFSDEKCKGVAENETGKCPN